MSDMSVSPANSVSPTYDPNIAGTDGFQSLTGESLLMYCESRLNSLDSEVNSRIGDQKSALGRRQAIQTAEQVFKKYGDHGPVNQQQWNECENSLFAAEQKLPAGDPGRAQLETFRSELEHQYCKDLAPDPHYPKDGEWKGTIDGLNKLVDDIKGGAEIQMLELQQLVSQRQTAVSLTTGMMQKLDQTTESIVKNV